MHQKFYLLLITLTLFTSCLEKEVEKVFLPPASSAQEEAIEEKESRLYKGEVTLKLTQQSGIIDIKITPIKKVHAEWDFENSTEYTTTVRDINDLKTCKVGHSLFREFKTSEDVSVENLTRESLVILIDNQAYDYSKYLRWMHVNDSIVIRMQQDHFGASEVTIKNNTIKEVHTIKNDTRLCLPYPIHNQLSKYSGPKIQGNEYYIFNYTIL